MAISDSGRRPLRYRADRWIRQLAMRVIGWCVPANEAGIAELSPSSVKRILLVRANFRMGNALLALPAIASFRSGFPDAQIDFVGSPISGVLFQNQPLNQHYISPRRFPEVLWQYPRLIQKLRANQYDMAVDVSCSHSGLGSFVVGLSGARIRAGLAGKWDYFFDLKIPKLHEENKYFKSAEFLAAMRLEVGQAVGVLKFSGAEKANGLSTLESYLSGKTGKKVGVFVGGRRLRGKRWPMENFVDLIHRLEQRGCSVLAFLGPEETDMARALGVSLGPKIPLIHEPSVRKFAAMIAHLDLLICCDSGPMHLACSVGVPVVAIFQERDLVRWAPPASAARAVHGTAGVGTAEVLEAALMELSISRLTGPLATATDATTAMSG